MVVVVVVTTVVCVVGPNENWAKVSSGAGAAMGGDNAYSACCIVAFLA